MPLAEIDTASAKRSLCNGSHLSEYMSMPNRRSSLSIMARSVKNDACSALLFHHSGVATPVTAIARRYVSV